MQWKAEVGSDGHVHVRLIGYLDEEDARSAVEAVVALLDDQLRELHIEAQEMLGYRRGARVIWQRELWSHRRQIPRFILVGGNSVVRMSTSVVAMALGIPMFAGDLEVVERDCPVPRKRPRSNSRHHTRPMSRTVVGPPTARAKARRQIRGAQPDPTWSGVVQPRRREDSRPA